MLKYTFYLFLILGLGFFGVSCKKETNPTPSPSPGSSLSDTSFLEVSYGSHSRNVYDIFLPKGRDSLSPVVLMLHGGAWKAGRKEDMQGMVNLVKKAWPQAAIVNMNYRLASNTDSIHHPEIMNDISAAIQHIVSNKANYQISSKIGIMGSSAGGQLAMIYAYKYNTQQNIHCVGNIFGPSIINDWTWYNSTNIWLGGKVGDILTEYVGSPWDSTLYKSVSPYWNISASTPPTIGFHGSLDPIVPVYQSQWLKTKLSAFGVANEYHEYLAFHSFDQTQSADVVAKLVAFFKTHLSP